MYSSVKLQFKTFNLITCNLIKLHQIQSHKFVPVSLFSSLKVLEEEWELSDLDDSPRLTGGAPWRQTRGRRRRRKEEEVEEVVSAGQQVMCHLLAPPLEHSGRETPVSVDSIPLEWDHTVDVGESSSHEDDEDATFFSALSGDTIHVIVTCDGFYLLPLYPRVIIS